MRNKKKIVIPLAVAVILGISGCGTSADSVATETKATVNQENQSDYEFVFEGSSSDFANGATLNISIYGNKDDDKSLELRVREYPQILIEGNYEYVEGKGYKLYFNDASSSFTYTQFDPEKDMFSMKYTLDVGTLGSARVSLEYKDDSFAEIYDGEGLGRTPPTFLGTVYGVGSGAVSLICREDGTFTTAAIDNSFNGGRSGSWEYDEANDQYLLHFDPDMNYSTTFELNEADAEGHYCGYNKVTDGSTNGERQFVYSSDTDPLCFDLPITGPETLPINEPYKSAAVYDEATGRVDIKLSELDNLGELTSNLTRNSDTTAYENLPDIYYYAQEDGNVNFMPECVTTLDKETGEYKLEWSVTNGKYALAVGSYDPEY